MSAIDVTRSPDLWRDLQSREGLAVGKFWGTIANEQNQGNEGVRVPSVMDVKK